MLIDQSEIDSLLAAGAGPPAPPPKIAPRASAPSAAPPRPQPAAASTGGPTETVSDVSRLMRLRVSVIVQLARRPLPVSKIRSLSVGAIIEFDRPVETWLDLLIRNHRIGAGEAVKVGENFGLRVLEIAPKRERITSMGK
ncbi:MAG: FliM/FliN family flagellar motor switch protein [Phycisphaerae bacterium]|nr:FliM/FliN family flagellar motor switch protein [Phycisphaerae bacterium]